MKTSAFLLALLPTVALAGHSEHKNRLNKRCTGTIKSLDDVKSAVKCTDVRLESFTVPAGKTLELDLLDGTVVHQMGDIKFGTKNWEGPLMSVTGKNIDYRGNGHKLDGNGKYYWDGKGGNGGVTKPKFFKVKFSGSMTNVVLYNQPVHGFSVSNPAALNMRGITVDVSEAGDLGHNTDAFDVSSSTGLTIQDSTIKNQDDCIAVNDATNLVFQNNVCDGGHGISIGSIKTGKNVKNVQIKNNKVTNSQQGLRIKTYSGATDASVTDITYSGNTVTGATKYGVVIQQDYTNSGATGKATKGVPIKGVHFTGTTNSVAVGSKAKEIYILCASGSCSDFDFSALKVSGGSKGSISGVSVKNSPI
ncbi:hypothetical protein JCM8097_006828 [Rhodosporidiobolus ruineniae]